MGTKVLPHKKPVTDMKLTYTGWKKIRNSRIKIRAGKRFWSDLCPENWGGQGMRIEGVPTDIPDRYSIWASMHGNGYYTRIGALWGGQWAYTLRRRLRSNKDVLHAILKPLLGDSKMLYVPQQGLAAYAAGGLEYMNAVLHTDTMRICQGLSEIFQVSCAKVSQSDLDPNLFHIGKERTVYALSDGDAADKYAEYEYAIEKEDFFDFEKHFFKNYYLTKDKDIDKSASISGLLSSNKLMVYSADEFCRVPENKSMGLLPDIVVPTF